MNTITINTADAKEEFSELINRVAHNKERIILTRRGKDVAAIIPIDDLMQLVAMQSKTDLNEATDALKEARQAGTITIEELLKKLG